MNLSGSTPDVSTDFRGSSSYRGDRGRVNGVRAGRERSGDLVPPNDSGGKPSVKHQRNRQSVFIAVVAGLVIASTASAGPNGSSAQHPRVFMNAPFLRELATRVNSPGSFSAEVFSKLADRAKAHLAAKIDWDAAYAGCDIYVYLHTFSYESAGGYAGQTRTAAELASALHVKTGLAPPAGAAIVASRLSLYAALIRAGAKPPEGAPTADQAAAFATRILMAWADRGFRDRNGVVLGKAEQFCDGDGKFVALTQSSVGLQVARGVVYSVHAQDLLESTGALGASQQSKLNRFHTDMFDLIHEASDFQFNMPEMKETSRTCDRFSNHKAAHLMGLLSIARLFDDKRKFNAVYSGSDQSLPVALSWTAYFDHAVYGEHDHPIGCYKNSGPDSLTPPPSPSHPSFQSADVAPGEIEDRYRHANQEQAFGYTSGVLADLNTIADLLSDAGIDFLRYRGSHGQSLEMAAEYYACYAKNVGFKNTVTADNARACPDYQQYVGQIVNGVETAMVMSAYHFPGNAALTEVEAAAKKTAGENLLDPLRFGRWRD
jgi:hypothetical protein